MVVEVPVCVIPGWGGRAALAALRTAGISGFLMQCCRRGSNTLRQAASRLLNAPILPLLLPPLPTCS